MRGLQTRSVLLVVFAFGAAGCSDRQIRVEMSVTGEGTSRAFASNTLAKDDLARLTEVYARDPEQDAATGGQRFAGTFANSLPSEVGNRNGTSEVRSRLGVTRFYFETFAARADEWSALRARIDAGELWVRLFGRWAERGLREPSKREEWRQYVERTLVPLSSQLALMWAATASNVHAIRLEQRVRGTDDHRPVTEEERLIGRTGIPMLLTIADAGLLTPSEAHRLLLVAADANATKAEREWVMEEVGKPALLRLVQRFRPETTSLKNVGWTSLALNFWMWAQTSPERNEILLASPVISEEDKESLRKGGVAATLPPPFGVDFLSAPRKTDTEVRLATGERPFLTNGEWLEESREVRFRHAFVDAARRTSLMPPSFYAAWSEPDAAVQKRLFGEVLLRGSDLAEYGVWFESMPPAMRGRWDEALDRLGGDGTRAPLQELRRELEAERPVPAALARWLDGEQG